MLESWLKSEVLLAIDDAEGYKESYRDCYHALAQYVGPLRILEDDKKHPQINWYTFIMVGHLARNLSLLNPDDILVKKDIDFIQGHIFQFMKFILENKKTFLLDFCLSFISPLEKYLSGDGLSIVNQAKEVLVGRLEKAEFWETKDHNEIAHLLMDLHIVGVLPNQYIDRGLETLTHRIEKVLSHNPINLQILTRLVRALGELAKDIPNITEKLYRQLNPIYADNIINEILRVVIDEKGYAHTEISRFIARMREGAEEQDQWRLLKKLYFGLFDNPGYKTNPDLEYLGIVKPPDLTLQKGGDCDCQAALFISLLLGAGFKKDIYLFHLSQEYYEDNKKKYALHITACIKKPREPGDNPDTEYFYCLDPN